MFVGLFLHQGSTNPGYQAAISPENLIVVPRGEISLGQVVTLSGAEFPGHLRKQQSCLPLDLGNTVRQTGLKGVENWKAELEAATGRTSNAEGGT